MGHYSSECRNKKKSGENHNKQEESNESVKKKQKTGGHGDWDETEFSGMLKEEDM